MKTPLPIHANHLPDQRAAEAAMKAAGVKPPRKCECENPAIDTDYDGYRTCIYCGRAPRGRR